jgi:hypothetical protein
MLVLGNLRVKMDHCANFGRFVGVFSAGINDPWWQNSNFKPRHYPPCGLTKGPPSLCEPKEKGQIIQRAEVGYEPDHKHQ